MPVPRREDAVVLGQRREGPLLLLRLPGQGRRRSASSGSIEHLDFVGAVEWLAGQSGITLRYTDKVEGEGRKRKARLTEAIGRAVDWYHERLLTGARRRTRPGPTCAVGASTATRCGSTASAGPPTTGTSWSGTCRSRRQGAGRHRSRLPEPPWAPAGLLPGPGAVPDLRRPGRPDRLRWPGHARGRGPEVPATPPETPLYDKSKVLYGLNWAKDAVVKADEVIVCEGYTDVIGFARAGRRPGGRHLWHRAHRGARPGAEALRPAGGAGLRPRRRRPWPPPSASTSGSSATSSRWRWPTCRRGRTPATSPAPTRSGCAPRSRSRRRSSASGSSGSLAARQPAPPPRGGCGPPRPPWR